MNVFNETKKEMTAVIFTENRAKVDIRPLQRRMTASCSALKSVLRRKADTPPSLQVVGQPAALLNNLLVEFCFFVPL